MSSIETRTGKSGMPSGLVSWRGRSGAIYALALESLEDFAMGRDALYLLARGDEPLWVGTAEDLVGDVSSRTRFRKAMALSTAVFSLVPAPEAGLRLSTIFDLEAAVPLHESAAQAA